MRDRFRNVRCIAVATRKMGCFISSFPPVVHIRIAPGEKEERFGRVGNGCDRGRNGVNINVCSRSVSMLSERFERTLFIFDM
jgi:hypothetical protein